MRRSNFNQLILPVLYWVSFWMLIFVPIYFSGNSDGSVTNFAIAVALLSAVGGVINAVSWRDRSSNLGRIAAGILRWSSYWALIAAAIIMFPRECKITPGMTSSSCEQWNILMLIILMPVVFICTAIASFFGNIIYAFLFRKNSPR